MTGKVGGMGDQGAAGLAPGLWRLTPHLTSPLEEQTFAQPRISLYGGQPDQIGPIGLHRRIRGLREGLLEGGRDGLGRGEVRWGGFLPAQE